MKYKKTILVLCFLICVFIIIYWWTYSSNFVKNNLIKYTGVTEFILEAEYYDNGQSFIKVILTDQDRIALLKKHKFELSTDKLKGKVTCPYIQYSNNDYLYFVDVTNGGQYGYILYCLKRSDNTLILYEYFGD